MGHTDTACQYVSMSVKYVPPPVHVYTKSNQREQLVTYTGSMRDLLDYGKTDTSQTTAVWGILIQPNSTLTSPWNV